MSLDRGLDAATTTAITAATVAPVTFVKLELDSGTLYLHNSIGTVTWDSQDWLGLGDFGGINSVQESNTLSAYEVEMVLSGLDSALMDEVLNQPYYLRPVTVYMGAFDTADFTLVSDPTVLWEGAIDSARAVLGGSNSIVLSCESEFMALDKSNGALFSDSDLQKRYPGDKFLRWASATEDVEIRWGDSSFTTTGSPKPTTGGGLRGTLRR